MDAGPGGKECVVDADCYAGWKTDEETVLPALNIKEQAIRCCQYTALDKMEDGGFTGLSMDA